MRSLFPDGDVPASWAMISDCGLYRHLLGRRWADGPCVAFLLFNPSTADALKDDHTVRKGCGFAKRWGYGSMIFLNLWGLRSTDPRAVARAEEPVGSKNDLILLKALGEVQRLVCAWGCSTHMKGPLRKRTAEVMRLIKPLCDAGLKVECLGYSKDGSPRHPLRLAYDTPLEKFEVRL